MDIEFIAAPAGTLYMGSTLPEVEACVAFWAPRLVNASYTTAMFRSWILKEVPRHPVEVAAFAISKYPVTNGQYRQFVADRGASLPRSLVLSEPANHPVWGMSYDDAAAYCAWLSSRLGASCRLPTESEWEYAARGTSTTEYPFGDSFDARCCNTFEAGIGTTTPVDRYAAYPSWLGVCDLAGNVEEWTASCYEVYPGGTFVDDDLVTAIGPRYRILRGGSFALGGDLARCARRHGPYPAPVFEYRGFRVVRDLA